ncbi:helix-turn-helix domain-containing protein [Enterococcus faecium]|uniref:helix-turn-helix domain-containing protein n=1 Tax=Enterococcus faecium TaxID=1352 RepID=UPI000FDBD4E3|nr:helix-turn-helix domain-containing protein [Enterococcus faecium]
MTDIAEITQRDREKIKEYVESSKFLTYTMLAERFGISKSYLSLILTELGRSRPSSIGG